MAEDVIPVEVYCRMQNVCGTLSRILVFRQCKEFGKRQTNPDLLRRFRWKILVYSFYSPDLLLYYQHVFGHQRRILKMAIRMESRSSKNDSTATPGSSSSKVFLISWTSGTLVRQLQLPCRRPGITVIHICIAVMFLMYHSVFSIRAILIELNTIKYNQILIQLINPILIWATPPLTRIFGFVVCTFLFCCLHFVACTSY